ncbi:carboxylesterase/lipase family protein [Microbacterium aurantiacum]|uniref:carboxylesterase/lipase family protein n=1 Tax=Microbacterium aurantiacum TaxID=162393 RepID=UPI000C803F51|nr:carboxylesterase family protein [Microbacterium aurantiacum]
MVIDAPIVQTSAGPVRGFWREELDRPSAAFLGIPFAQPPVGELRFAAPVPPEPWTDVRDATGYGATALRHDPGGTLIPEPAIPGDGTLNVNVFTPDAEGSLPVLVWIHGGGYTAGSPASPWYDGRAFNRDGVVTVTISYRLGFDGFGWIDGAPHNRGVRDWLAALEWVRQNIAAFGGDPDRVTVGGQSAGGGAVLTLLGMPTAQHLFRSAFAVSAALADVPVDIARQRAERLAALTGVAPTLEELRTVPEERIHALQRKAESAKRGIGLLTDLIEQGSPWGPMVDGDLVRVPTLESLRSGIGGDKPLLLGAADDEFTMVAEAEESKLRLIPPGLLLRPFLRDREVRHAYLEANAEQRAKGTAAVAGRYVSDHIFRVVVPGAAEARASTEAPTWAYRFSWVSPAKGWACHCLDVPFWFDGLDLERVHDLAGDAPPQSLADEMHSAAVAFVSDADPGWPAWRTQPGTSRVFGGSGPEISETAYDSTLALL